MNPKPPLCHNCVHYFITWDVNFPYGCHAMGFRTRRNPGLEVRRAMHGQPCLMYAPKKSSPRKPGRFATIGRPPDGR